ncbi:MAG TPA: hypothetical protein VGP82_15630 [Ktedonobacterales bacterium]|nr:hypothetical protein [Ktedonobacterales bacterium]
MTILLPDDGDLRATVAAVQRVQQRLSEPAYHDGKPLSAIALHHAMYAQIYAQIYAQVTGALNSQMTCSAIRLTAGAYASAKANRHSLNRPFAFHTAQALFPVGVRGRDADFRTDGSRSIWTVAGRKRLCYIVPDAFKVTLAAAKEIDSMTVFERDGRLLGRVTITLDFPDPQGVHPVGVDLNETNTLVAFDPDGKTLFVSGKAVKVANKWNYKTRKRLQKIRGPQGRAPEHTVCGGCSNGLAANVLIARAPSPKRRQSSLSPLPPNTPYSSSRHFPSRSRRKGWCVARLREGVCRSGSVN